MHFKNGIRSTIEINMHFSTFCLKSSGVLKKISVCPEARVCCDSISGRAFHITSNSRYGASNLACIVPTVHNFHKTSNYPSAPNSFPRKHLFSFPGLLVKAREIVQWDPFNITKRIFPDLCISFVFATTIH